MKQYISPNMEVVTVKTQQLLASSSLDVSSDVIYDQWAPELESFFEDESYDDYFRN